jgi:hypothetical protein
MGMVLPCTTNEQTTYGHALDSLSLTKRLKKNFIKMVWISLVLAKKIILTESLRYILASTLCIKLLVYLIGFCAMLFLKHMSKNRNKYATCEWFGLVVCRKQLEYENSSREDQIEMLENKLKVGTAHVYVATYGRTVRNRCIPVPVFNYDQCTYHFPELSSVLMYTTF